MLKVGVFKMLNFDKPLYMVSLNGSIWKSRPCYFIRKPSRDSGFPFLVVIETAQGNGPYYFEPYRINEHGRIFGRFHDTAIVSNNENPVNL